MTGLLLKTLTSQNKPVDNSLSATLVSLIDCTVKKVARSARNIAQVTEATVDNPGFFAPTAAHVKVGTT